MIELLKKQIYRGWIHARSTDRYSLFNLGVKGVMSYNRESSCFENCDCTATTIERLKKKWFRFDACTFTAIDDNGNVLPEKDQPYWKERAK